MPSEYELRKIAQEICRLATKDCIMDEPGKSRCTLANCRMMSVAQEAVEKAILLK